MLSKHINRLKIVFIHSILLFEVVFFKYKITVHIDKCVSDISIRNHIDIPADKAHRNTLQFPTLLR